jgi:hypothetical protein
MNDSCYRHAYSLSLVTPALMAVASRFVRLFVITTLVAADEFLATNLG